MKITQGLKDKKDKYKYTEIESICRIATHQKLFIEIYEKLLYLEIKLLNWQPRVCLTYAKLLVPSRERKEQE